MPAYSVQWAAMMWAKERGCTEYDLWGVPDYPIEQLLRERILTLGEVAPVSEPWCERAVTRIEKSGSARRAVAASDREGNRDTLPRMPLRHVGADALDGPGHFMSGHMR